MCSMCLIIFSSSSSLFLALFICRDDLALKGTSIICCCSREYATGHIRWKKVMSASVFMWWEEECERWARTKIWELSEIFNIFSRLFNVHKIYSQTPPSKIFLSFRIMIIIIIIPSTCTSLKGVCEEFNNKNPRMIKRHVMDFFLSLRPVSKHRQLLRNVRQEFIFMEQVVKESASMITVAS